MLHIVEVGPQVKIDDSGFTLIDRLSHSVYRFMRCPFRPVSIRPRLEVSFEDRFQDELERTLNHPVADGGNRENADFVAPVLRDFLLPHRHGPIRVGNQFVPNLFQKALHSAVFNGCKRDPIDSGSPVVPFRRLVSLVQRFLLADMDVQSPKAMGWFSLRLEI